MLQICSGEEHLVSVFHKSGRPRGRWLRGGVGAIRHVPPRARKSALFQGLTFNEIFFLCVVLFVASNPDRHNHHCELMIIIIIINAHAGCVLFLNRLFTAYSTPCHPLFIIRVWVWSGRELSFIACNFAFKLCACACVCVFCIYFGPSTNRLGKLEIRLHSLSSESFPVCLWKCC